LIFTEIIPTSKNNTSMVAHKANCDCIKILVVDDDGFNHLAMETLLQKMNLDCDSAYNGQEAVDRVLSKYQQLCSETCQGYRLIFMDCSMPMMDGFQATKIINDYIQNGTIPLIPIIGCTAFTSKDKIKECKVSGMLECISKPIAKSELKRIISKYIGI